MKKILSVLLFSLVLLLVVACGSNTSTTGEKEQKEEPKKSEQADVSNEPKEEEKESELPKVEKDENGNYILDTVGQKIEDPNMGTVELMKIKEINEVVDIAPIKMTIHNLKLFKMTNVSEDVKAELAMFTDAQTVGDEVHYVQVSYSSENTEEKNIDWYGIEKVVLSNGQQLDAMMNDFIINDEDMDSIFYGKVKKEGAVGLIYKGTPEEITSVKMIIGESMDADSYNTITDKQQVEYGF